MALSSPRSLGFEAGGRCEFSRDPSDSLVYLQALAEQNQAWRNVRKIARMWSALPDQGVRARILDRVHC